MSKTLTTVTYHFVRRLSGSAWPRLKALEVDAFRAQLAYLRAHYQFVSIEQCFAALMTAGPEMAELPERAVLLTFDDAYRDHYETVFPILRELRIPAAFFPPAKAIECREVLDVNKIHFVLAAQPQTDVLVREIFSLLDRHREVWSLESNQDYWQRLAKPFRWDGKEVVFIKRLLQRELPSLLRRELVDTLFRKYVTCDEAGFSRVLYVSECELREMVQAGYYVGSHGYDHYWLEYLSPAEQAVEIERSLAFLRRLGIGTERWVIAYPYGSYNASLLQTARERGAVLGFTTKQGIADWPPASPLELPRLDTNDLPQAMPRADARASRRAPSKLAGTLAPGA